MATPAGFEPATPSLEGWCSIRLSSSRHPVMGAVELDNKIHFLIELISPPTQSRSNQSPPMLILTSARLGQLDDYEVFDENRRPIGRT